MTPRIIPDPTTDKPTLMVWGENIDDNTIEQAQRSARLPHAGLGTITSDLASLGFDAEWGLLRASDVGAPHRRERFFLLAYTEGGGRDGWSRASTSSRAEADNISDLVADTASVRRQRAAVATQRASKVSDTGFPPGPAGDWSRWDGPKPSVRRDTDGLSARLDRLHALGNAVVPQQVAVAFAELANRMEMQ